MKREIHFEDIAFTLWDSEEGRQVLAGYDPIIESWAELSEDSLSKLAAWIEGARAWKRGEFDVLPPISSEARKALLDAREGEK